MNTSTGEMMTASQMLTAKRLKGELQKLEKEREAYYQVVQDSKDPLLFYFLLRGASDSVYKGGYYMGKIVLPKDYPTNPGDFYMLTPSGRFNVNAKICLTNSGYHKEAWTPMWNISNMVIGFVSVFLSDTTSGISHIQETSAERKAKAANSMQYNLTNHKDICSRFDQYIKPDGTVRTDKEVEEFVQEKMSKFKKVKKTEALKDDKVKVVKKVLVKAVSVEVRNDDIVEVKNDDKEEHVTDTKLAPEQNQNALPRQDAKVDLDNDDKPQKKATKKSIKSKPKDVKDDPQETNTIDKNIVASAPQTNTKTKKGNVNLTNMQTVKVVKKTVPNRPKSYDEWKQMIAESTIRNHDPKLLSMTF